MRWAVIAVCVATAACGKGSGSGSGSAKGSGSATASGTGTATATATAPAASFAVPRITVDLSADQPPRAEEYAFYDGKTVRDIDISPLKGDPEKGGRAYKIDPAGHVTPDPSTFGPAKPPDPDDPQPPTRTTIVFADRAALAAPLIAAMATRRPDGCWGLAAATADGGLTTLAPAECPVLRPPGGASDELVQLAVWRGPDKISVGISRVEEIADVELAKLVDALRVDKQSAFFAERSDAAIAVHDAATIADVVEVVAAAHAAGFVDARVIAGKYLPVKLGGATGTAPEPAPPPTDD